MHQRRELHFGTSAGDIMLASIIINNLDPDTDELFERTKKLRHINIIQPYNLTFTRKL